MQHHPWQGELQPTPRLEPLVALGDGVGDIRLGGHPLELDEPALASGDRPEGGDHAVDRGVFAVALRQRRLSRRVVDERHHCRRHQLGKRGEGDDLGEDFEHIDVCSACGKQLDKPRRHHTMVVENLSADPEHVAPAVGGALLRRRVHSVGHVSSLVPSFAVCEEGVGVEHSHVQVDGVEGHEPGTSRRQDGDQGPKCRRQSRREGVVGPCRGVGCPGVDGFGRRPCHRSKDRLCQECHPPRQSRRVVRGEAVVVQGPAKLCQDLLHSARRGAQGHAVVVDVEGHALHDVLGGRRLCLGLLGEEAEGGEEVLEAVGGRLTEVLVLHAVKVIHVVTSRRQQQPPKELLQCIGGSVKIPN